jgi:lipopolysaccharide assembly outer membrane protein LptD (OstA)
VPILYLPYFYHSLEREPRKSGFLMPMPGHSSRRGMELSAGYFWAINRSYDLTYRGQYYPSRGLVTNLDFRGKPRAGSDSRCRQERSRPRMDRPRRAQLPDQFSLPPGMERVL